MRDPTDNESSAMLWKRLRELNRQKRRENLFKLRRPTRWELLIAALLTALNASTILSVLHGDRNNLNWANALAWISAITVALLWALTAYAALRHRRPEQPSDLQAEILSVLEQIRSAGTVSNPGQTQEPTEPNGGPTGVT
ncbi:hypothetical protein [Nocardia heshunensis]